jgi:hypothetical protein
MGAGRSCKAYYNTGTHATPVWVEIARGQDFSIDPTAETAEAAMRGSKWKKSFPTHLGLAATFGYLKKDGADTVYNALVAAFTGQTAMEFAFMDAAIATTGSKGWRAFFLVTGVKDDQAMGNAQAYEFSLAHALAEETGTVVDPDFYTVS